jgi:catechol 2,3-dioxygenase-like lactoylglutathione lyase family enzyme
MTGFSVTRAGAILGVADFAASLRFYRDQLGLEVVDDADAAHSELGEAGVPFLADIHHPLWGGSRFFCVDPDGYLVEIEAPG